MSFVVFDRVRRWLFSFFYVDGARKGSSVGPSLVGMDGWMGTTYLLGWMGERRMRSDFGGLRLLQIEKPDFFFFSVRAAGKREDVAWTWKRQSG